MNIGQLDRQVTLRQPAPAPANLYGAAGQTQVFTDVATVAASVKYDKGTEAVAANQNTATQRISFTIRYRADVRPTWQLAYEGRTFQITDVAEIGRRRGTILTCYSHG